MNLCNKKCNECPIVNHENSRMITKILNEAYQAFGGMFWKIVQDNCPNLTCCYDCHIDNFCHDEKCEIIESIKK